MEKLTREDLWSLEDYAQRRDEFRAEVMEHKRARRLPLGPDACLYFEDRMTMRYQVQEMLRVERVFEASGIRDELDAYNPLIPEGCNWKATMMIEIADVDRRRERLGQLVDIEDRVYAQVAGHDRTFAIADEDMDRETEEKTSSVHFLRFELTDAMVAAVKEGANVTFGVEDPRYPYSVDPIPEEVRESLSVDLA